MRIRRRGVLERLLCSGRPIKHIEIPVAFTKKSLAEKVCMLVLKDGLKYSEALLEICEQYDIDPHDIAKLVKGPLKAKLEAEAMRYNSIPNTNGNSLY